MTDTHNFSIIYEAVVNVSDLKARWLTVESQASPSIFLSWTWVGSLISAYHWRPFVLTLIKNELPVAIGLLGRQPFSRHGFVHGRGIFLNQTGVDAQDQVWIEYNDFLVADNEPDARRLCFQYLLKSIKNWDECYLGGVPNSCFTSIKDITDLSCVIDWRTPTYQVNLEKIRSNGGCYLASLSSNTRYQIRRAIKAYEKQGELRLIKAQSITQALAFFDAAGEFHRLRWGESIGESGYANPEFVRFHHTLIKTGWPSGEVEIFLLQVDSKPLGYFYNLIKNGQVYFYLSGIKQETLSILKPGLVGHSLAIQDYLDRGMLCYDFMGGDARYKKSLGTQGEEIVGCRVQKPSFVLRLEEKLKAIKNKLKK